MTTQLDTDLIDALPHIVWVHDLRGNTRYFNRAWAEYTGLTLEQTIAAGAPSLVHPLDLPELVRRTARASETGENVEYTYRLRRKDGSYRWHQARVVPLRRDADGKVSEWLGSATDIHEQHLLVLERNYLLEASKVLGTSLDVDRTLADVARLVVPHVADWCAIDLVGADGVLVRRAVAHIDPAKVELANQLWQRMPPKPSDPTGPYVVMRTGQPEFTREITDEMLVAGIPDPEILAMYRALGLRSALVVALAARGRAFGTLSLVTAEGGRLMDDRDVAFACELAIRISVAVDNSQLYSDMDTARRQAEAIAEELTQQSREYERTLLDLRSRERASDVK